MPKTMCPPRRTSFWYVRGEYLWLSLAVLRCMVTWPNMYAHGIADYAVGQHVGGNCKGAMHIAW